MIKGDLMVVARCGHETRKTAYTSANHDCIRCRRKKMGRLVRRKKGDKK